MTDSPKASHPIVAEMAARLNESQREFYEERAGIMEFEAGFDHAYAEALALLEIVWRYGWPAR